ncbi:MAG: sugar ABC transporter substrate-binding protein [Anaerolineales bacterium]|nr:sugar ABC transporter substrate-binding protein [Anaerolineales bacterium]MDW8447561.1 sugar ABC transporter substrate-binding protein [Anaerolineales bacterium]
MSVRVIRLILSWGVAVAFLLGACAPQTTETPAAPETPAATEAPPAVEPGVPAETPAAKPFEGVSINIMMEAVPDTEFVQAVLPKFQEATGMTVNIEVLNYAMMHEKLVPQLTAPEGAGSYDVIVVDNYWVGEFVNAGWLFELDERLAKSKTLNLDDYLPSMVNMVGRLHGKTYMIPFYNYAMALIYRDDLLNDSALKEEYKQKFGKDLALPATIEEYVELAKFMTRDTNGDGQIDFYGSSMMGLRPDPTTMEFLNYLYSAGGRIYDENWNVTINNEAGVKALSLYVDAMKNAAPPGAPAYGFDEAFSVMAQGQAFSYITFNWMLPQLNDPQKSQVVDKCKVVRVPGGKGLLGGWGWAIPVSSPNPDAAWAFIEWVESFEIAKERALLGGAPARADVFEDPDVLAKYPHYSEVEKIVGEAIPFPIMSRSPQVVEELGRAISEAVAGSKTVVDSLNEAAEVLKGLVD